MNSPVRYISFLALHFLYIIVIRIRLPSDLLAIDQKKLLTPEPLLESPLKVYPEEGETLDLLVASICAGDSLVLMGDFIGAEKVYKHALVFMKELKVPWYKILLFNRIGFINNWLLDIDESLEYYNQSLTLIKKENLIIDSLAYLEAFTFFYINSRYNKKYQLNDIAEDEKEINKITVDDFKNPARKLKFHFLKAYFVIEEGVYDEYREGLLDADQLLSSIPLISKFWSFLIRFDQGLYYKYLTDYNLAFPYFKELEQKVEHEKELENFKYFVYINLLITNSFLQRNQAAAEYIEKLKPYLKNQYHPYFCLNYIRIGEVCKHMGLFEEALKNFKIAERIMLENGIEDEKLIYTYYFLAKYYKEIEWDQEMMLKYLHMAENIMNQCSAPTIESYIVYELGKYYYRMREYDLAIITFNLLLDDVDKLVSDKDYFESRYPYLSRTPYLSVLDYRSAAFYYLSEQKNFDMISLKYSFENYKLLVLLYEKMLKELGYEESRMTSLKKVRKAFENLFEVGYTLYKQTEDDSYLDELFSYSERSKAYMLKNYVSDELAKRMGGVTEESIDEARRIKKEIDSMQYSLSQRIPQSENYSDQLLINRILDKQEEYENFIDELENRYPDYAQIKNRGNTPTIRNIQNLLKSEQVLLEYYFIYNEFYAFYIDKDTIILASHSIGREFPDQLLSYRSLFDKVAFSEFNEENLMNFVEQSNFIYSLAIKPFENLIANKRLIIVPDEELCLIPFETLVVKPPDSLLHTPYRNLPYLIMYNPVSYIYSASQLSIKKSSRLRNVDYAGFAPDYSIIDPRQDYDNNTLSLQSLPGAKNEVLAAKKYFRGRVYTNDDINKACYFKESQRRKIVHLAMHAVLDSVEPMNSWFVFSTQYDKDEEQLHAYEIYANKIASSLVVLSACNTGMGTMNRGEGVFSIARAYLLAGVNNVIYTQWSVADNSSAQLMDKFYYYLSQGMPADVALQKAKIDFILRGDPVKAFPFYWSGYVIMGSPIQISSQKAIYLGLALGLLLILMGYLIWKRR